MPYGAHASSGARERGTDQHRRRHHIHGDDRGGEAPPASGTHGEKCRNHGANQQQSERGHERRAVLAKRKRQRDDVFPARDRSSRELA